MSTRKRNEWLDADASDEEIEQGYDSEEQEESRGALTGRSSKRRKVEDVSDEGSEDEEEHRFSSSEKQNGTRLDEEEGSEADAQNADGEVQPQQDEDDGFDSMPQLRDPTVKPLTAKQLAASQKAVKKTGVIYLSRTPPFMKPQTLKHYLSPFGEIGRVFLTPEDPAAHSRRVKAGGNKKRSFTDGWVEFLSKRDAKMVAENLNGNIIGGRKGSFYYDDVWNIKYLKGFKWHHLTEQISNENAERAARLRAEISKTRRENKAFVEDIERSKMLEGMQAKKRAKLERAGVIDAGEGKTTATAGLDAGSMKREFRQNQVKSKSAGDGPKTEQPEAVKRVLSKIF